MFIETIDPPPQWVSEKTSWLNCQSSLSGEHKLAKQLNEPSCGSWDPMEEVHNGRCNLQLLLSAWLVLSLLLGHNRDLQPLLEVLKQLLTQLLAEHIAEQLGEVGKPLDETEIQISVVPKVQQQLSHHLAMGLLATILFFSVIIFKIYTI